MQKGDIPSVEERRASQNRVYRMAFGVSLLLHLLLLIGWRVIPIPPSPLSAAGPRNGDFLAAGGGMQSLNLQVNSRPIVRPRVPVISVEVTEPLDFNAEPQLDLSAAVGEAPGLGEGPPGIEGGQGRGDGGTAAQGYFQMIPPSPRGIIMPPTPSRSLRGEQVEVWVFVDATGRVVADSTRLNPPTSDGGFNRRLIKDAAEWAFNPAKRNEEPIAAWFPYKWIM